MSRRAVIVFSNVMQNGYMINGRVMRAADVGVVRAPPEQQ